MKNQIVSAVLAVVLLFSLLCACAQKDTESNVTTADTAASSEEADPLAERKAVADDLPATDLNGLQWRVYAQEAHVKGYFYSEAEDGEVVNDAIFYANRTVEERFNVDLVVDYSGNDDMAQPAAIQKMVAAGDSTYSLVTCHDVLGCNLSLSNNFVNLYNINHLDFKKPWWHDIDAISVLGQVYMVSSDMSVFQLNNTFVIYFNKDIMDDFKIEYPYQTVLDGSWTLDKLIAMTHDVYIDVNGDSADDQNDIHGFSILPNCYGWLDSMGIQTTMKSKDDILTVNEDQTKITSLVEAMYDWLFNTAGGRSSMVNNQIDNQPFMDGKFMMLYSQVGQSVKLYRFIDKLNYGFVPVPKYDESQENYISTFMDYPFFVPNTQSADQLDVTGLMIEALSAEGYKQIFPAYYEIALKVKYAQDNESVQMIEIVNQTTRPSFSWCFENWQGLQQSLYTLILAKNSDYSSYYAKTVKSAQARVKLLIKMFEKME